MCDELCSLKKGGDLSVGLPRAQLVGGRRLMGQRVTGSGCRRAGPRYLGRGAGPLMVKSGRCESGGAREEQDGDSTREGD
jgi:hypothetical protein